jgi:uncharacterized membrane protein HdeD (DUF308 family)
LIRIILLLLGTEFVRRRWRWLAVIGVCWAVAGLLIFIDALDGKSMFPTRVFAAAMLIEGLVAIAVTMGGLDSRRRNRLRLIKGLLFVFVALLIFDPYPDGPFLLSMLMGLIFLIGGMLRVTAATVVHFRGWRLALTAGVVELVFAILILSPWPIPYTGTIPAAVGLGLMVSGWALLRVGYRLRRLPRYASVSLLTGRRGLESLYQPLIYTQETKERHRGDLIVHVWTPVGSADGAIRRPIIDRYAAAVDRKGVISTGHAAMEVPPDIYISHYPGVEIERSPDQFMHTLKATDDNDIPGVFQPSYAEEAAGWCESTEKVVFHHLDYDYHRLKAYWEVYRQDNTYNLTNRNCSSTVTHALETALAGVIGRRGHQWWRFFRLLHSPELWLASQLYRRADTMAWTPGLTLDYARALHGVIHPPQVGWLIIAKAAWRRYRHHHRPA